MQKHFLSSFLIFLFYRLSSVFVIQTFYVPDEYWQSLEVAHKMTFGYGYLTWEWKHGLRSYLYPSCFALAYQILKFFHIDHVYLIILVPKFLQAFLTAVSDQYFVHLCKTFGFDEYWAKTYVFTNWFWYYCGCRTITNTLETSLAIISLYYFPWELFVRKAKKKKKLDIVMPYLRRKSIKYMTLSGISCVMRPTAFTIWGPLVMFHLISLPVKNLKSFCLICLFPVSLSILVASLIIDYLWYDKLIIPAFNFFIFNVFRNISSFYGEHPFYWYMTQGLPVILGLHVLPFALGLISLFRDFYMRKNILFERIFIIWIVVLVINILILSNIPHKEFRFALPLLPVMMLIAVKSSSEFFKSRKYKSVWITVNALGFIVATIFFGVFHQRGSLQLMNYLSNVAINCKPQCLFLFLMPCHSTPLYSHLHVNVSTRFLTCEPPIFNNFYDESDDFFNNPLEWLQRYWDDRNAPSHVALFDSIENLVSSFFKTKGYTKKNYFFHTVFPENNVGKYIVVYEPS